MQPFGLDVQNVPASVEALPPAASQTRASGAASYNILSFPPGACESGGYMKSPPLQQGSGENPRPEELW